MLELNSLNDFRFHTYVTFNHQNVCTGLSRKIVFEQAQVGGMTVNFNMKLLGDVITAKWNRQSNRQ